MNLFAHRRRRRSAVMIMFVAFSGFLRGDLFGQERPLRVFILAGQSNMQGHAKVQTLESMRWNPSAAPLLDDLLDEEGKPVVCERVWISSVGSADEEQVGRLTVGYGAKAGGPKIGPEYTFGLYASKLLDEPILIIKTAWGGKSLNTDFRPPGAGPYQWSDVQIEKLESQKKDIAQIRTDKINATGRYYRLMIDHVRNVLSDIKRVVPDYQPARGYQLAGFVWFQGWNDMVDSGTYPDRGQPGGYDQYSQLLAQLIRDVRKDLSAPELPFVIGVMGVGGPTDKYGAGEQRYKSVHQSFRDAMAAPSMLPEFQGRVVAVRTEEFWDMEVVRLREIEKTIKPKVDALNKQVKDGTVSRETGQSRIDELYAATFSPRELSVLKQSVSNFDFHYMGSAGVMTQIGKAFAESAIELTKDSR
ncbi:MAG: hypothetical protein KDA91_00460 [Planctomycetaceae bacterium]|nr:hypothetical protein [Planctomycetaceae bacterium]